MAATEDLPKGEREQPLQINSIDGFFNRKRGRPPKNRFVEVYKSAQKSPQAIFTSFKLEKNELTLPAIPAAAPNDSMRVGMGTTLSLSPGRRRRKRAQKWVASEAAGPLEPMDHIGSANQASQLESHRERRNNYSQSWVAPPSQMEAAMATFPLVPICRERLSVVRAAGTFYPTALDQCQGLDLSMRAKQAETLPAARSSNAIAAPEINSSSDSGLLFKQLLELHQRQELLSGLLRTLSVPVQAPSPPPPPPVVQLEIQQKLLLLNVAAAAAAAAAATTTATATTTTAMRTRRIRQLDIPQGYLKFRFNEDCQFERCGYRRHQSHFHCSRRDCHYSFCDKTRFVQHTARHERLDSLMGEDFRQYRAHMQCGVASCSFSRAEAEEAEKESEPRKTSHFHCCKCDYVCGDTNKVVAHRRLHAKLEYVRNAGFQKIASNESCCVADCSHALRQTHYHCLSCGGRELTRAQLGSHKHRSN